ncbi:MAG: molybdopterin-dependent oxidoreductase [Candidatus Brockarchaeota archaeon]|nr:molybdopterin-dependent oxidoreductase [Candidatus Brockarchaeota archaeon]
MKKDGLPPGQRAIDSILRWNVDHPGIVPQNPKFDPDRWTLTVDGEVGNKLELSWNEFLKLPSVDSVSDFHCVEGWSVVGCRWHGVRFKTLVQMVKPSEDAKCVTFRCSDGYTTSLDLEDLLGDDVLLAYKLDGKFLGEPLGKPLRLVVPSKYAYKSAMWIERVSFTKTKELGYWERRGYSDRADVWENDRFAK